MAGKFLLFSGLFFVPAIADGVVRSRCEFFNSTCAEKLTGPGKIVPGECRGERECPDPDQICYVVWSNSSDGRHRSGHDVKLMGCIEPTPECIENKVCLEEDPRPKSGHLFCCCRGDLCNAKFEWVPRQMKEDESSHQPDRPTDQSDGSGTGQSLLTTVYIVVPLVVALFAICVCWFVVRQRKAFSEIVGLSTVGHGQENEADLIGPTSAAVVDLVGGTSLPAVELVEIKARGRFGAVWRGRMGGRDVAVKIFPLQDKNSWSAEKDIYGLARMGDHDDILKFIGVDRRGENLAQEYWLATEFHERGSLCDFLKSNLVTWDELCNIAMSIARGLTFLHEEIPADNRGGMKPAIAHRDFKSKNVLIRSNMTACIADFGLALIFEPGKSCGDTHGQVGTRRYMAPEVLEGAINFSRDAFLRIDMYACGLVMWELATRCSVHGLPAPDEYKLPFEAEANNPSLEQMQDLVVNQKVRPRLNPAWRRPAGFALLCETVGECWDHDAEARLSASCVVERVTEMRHANNVAANNINSLNNFNNINNHRPAGIGGTTADSGLGSTFGDSDGLESESDNARTPGNVNEMTPLFIQPRN